MVELDWQLLKLKNCCLETLFSLYISFLSIVCRKRRGVRTNTDAGKSTQLEGEDW
jgi:hypothetical protein